MAKILYLSNDEELFEFLKSDNNELVQTMDDISENFVKNEKFDFIISYRYLRILKEDVLRHFNQSAINLHISFLPYNRGVYPNLWSFVENTPNGVSIHYMSAGLDKGDIIAQKQIVFNPENETFLSSYNTLQSEIKGLFKKNWLKIKNKTIKPKAQIGIGSYHRYSDADYLLSLMPNGWDTNVAEFLEILNKNR
ncbi:Linear gramicidin synthase subunit A [Campylobacter majalis]|uniref:Linear gramicidin synthase subunit A n=1 Tax=Campylobacter majalis TaxID=2790656 RepID=A0ABM8Q559_9BACT|nr:formyltransferase family protein [Campylobacter majalis]CAD7288043.1 Linear gramicidin synthase subunit A [Campylobacter majalis]